MTPAAQQPREHQHAIGVLDDSQMFDPEFDKLLDEAEAEARRKKRGIWMQEDIKD